MVSYQTIPHISGNGKLLSGRRLGAAEGESRTPKFFVLSLKNPSLTSVKAGG